MNKKTILTAIILIVIIGAFLVLKREGSFDANQPIKIAALLSLTGDASAWGENSQKAIQLATKEINEKGGINGRHVEMIYEDTAGDPKKAVSAYQLVTSVDHVTAVIGPLNQTEDTAVMPLIYQTNTPTIVPGYIPLQNRSDLSNPLLTWMDAQIEAGRIAQYAFGQGIRKMAVIGTLDSWETVISNAFAEKFRSLGGTITDIEIAQPDSSDMKSPVTKALAGKPEAVFIGTYYQFVNTTKTLHDLGYQGKLFGLEVDDYLAGQASGWVDSLKFIAPDYYTGSFVSDFKAAYGTTPGIPAGQSYDAANILFSFLATSTDQNDILKQMKDFRSYDGVSGKLQIAADGRTTLPTALFELNKGVVTRVSALE